MFQTSPSQFQEIRTIGVHHEGGPGAATRANTTILFRPSSNPFGPSDPQRILSSRPSLLFGPATRSGSPGSKHQKKGTFLVGARLNEMIGKRLNVAKCMLNVWCTAYFHLVLVSFVVHMDDVFHCPMAAVIFRKKLLLHPTVSCELVIPMSPGVQREEDSCSDCVRSSNN